MAYNEVDQISWASEIKRAILMLNYMHPDHRPTAVAFVFYDPGKNTGIKSDSGSQSRTLALTYHILCLSNTIFYCRKC